MSLHTRGYLDETPRWRSTYSPKVNTIIHFVGTCREFTSDGRLLIHLSDLTYNPLAPPPVGPQPPGAPSTPNAKRRKFEAVVTNTPPRGNVGSPSYVTPFPASFTFSRVCSATHSLAAHVPPPNHANNFTSSPSSYVKNPLLIYHHMLMFSSLLDQLFMLHLCPALALRRIPMPLSIAIIMVLRALSFSVSLTFHSRHV